MKIKRLKVNELPEILEILRHDNLKYADGSYPEESWISALITKGIAYGAYKDKKLKSVLLAENMIAGGIYVWFLAVRSEDIGKGYGQILYDAFEDRMTKKKKHWVFLTSWNKSESFYSRNGFDTTNLIVKEFCKVIKHQ